MELLHMHTVMLFTVLDFAFSKPSDSGVALLYIKTRNSNGFFFKKQTVPQNGKNT